MPDFRSVDDDDSGSLRKRRHDSLFCHFRSRISLSLSLSLSLSFFLECLKASSISPKNHKIHSRKDVGEGKKNHNTTQVTQPKGEKETKDERKWPLKFFPLFYFL